MKVLIGVDPHKVSVAVAAIDEATGELLERVSFPQDRTGGNRHKAWPSPGGEHERTEYCEAVAGIGASTDQPEYRLRKVQIGRASCRERV